MHSVGNTLLLHQSALIEAFNLKAAIEFQLKNRKISACSSSGVVMFYTQTFTPPPLRNTQKLKMSTAGSEIFSFSL